MDLLPGMYSTPIHAVPKPRSEKLRLVNDHSAGPFSLNSMIARSDVAGAKMDSISDLIGALLKYRKQFPDKSLVLFKSDVSAAYRRLPLHPLWQIKQIVTIDGNRHVDRCTSFGGRASCRDYTAFMGLVLWIAIVVKLLEDLFGYIDDNFGFDEEGNVIWYGPYQCYYPSKQARLLELWDEIGLPHDKAKQEYAPVLRIIGFMVDPKLMRVSMDEEDKTRLLQNVKEFSATAPGGTRRTLREFQQLTGWINWSFNVFPLLKPALSNVYAKMKGKVETHAKIFVSKAVVRDCYMPVRELRSTSFSVIPVTSPSFPSCFRPSRHASVLPVMLPFFPSLLRHRHLFVLLPFVIVFHRLSVFRPSSILSLRIYSAPFMFRVSFLGFVATLSYFNIFTFLWLDNKFIVFVIL